LFLIDGFLRMNPSQFSPSGKNVRAIRAAGRLAARRHRAAPGGKESITLCAFYMQDIALKALVGLENEAVAVAARVIRSGTEVATPLPLFAMV
jgi:hypothetical protein